MKTYNFDEQFVQTMVNFLDGLYSILKVFPIINPVYTQQIATLILQIKSITDEQNTPTEPQV